jgi:hypothetical protein
MSQTAEAPSNTTRNQSKATKSDSGAQAQAGKSSVKRVHIVLQGKGGIGKTLVASFVAQYLKEHDRGPACFDTDPVNGSLTAFEALNAKPVKLLNEDAINVKGVDQLVENILNADSDVVVDNGAASFLPFSRYMIENGIAELIESSGKQVVVHAIIVGGGNAMDTARGLDAVLSQFPPSVRVVVWINEFFGAVEVNGRTFEQTPLYENGKDRIDGIVTLKRQNQLTFGSDVSEMLERRLTFAEALADTATFLTVPRQRLTMMRRDIWEQLDRFI